VSASRLAKTAGSREVAVSAGHSDAAFVPVYAAFDGEFAGVTHLFNAMSPLHHREQGIPGAAFAHPRVICGVIADGQHVHPEMISLVFRMLGPDRLYLVTDAIAAAGMGAAGEYPMATRRAHLDEGTLAGSVLTMNEAFRNVLTFTGCTIPEAVRMAATTPARLAGVGWRKGRLAHDYAADVTVSRTLISPSRQSTKVARASTPVRAISYAGRVPSSARTTKTGQ
jgi:N-acetylglucosamine-6-phosphate deacetylase